MHAGIYTPRQTLPWADIPWPDTPQCMLGYTQPCPVHSGMHTPCPVYAGIHMGTAEDGTHPTGMHSCLTFFWVKSEIEKHLVRMGGG